MVVIDRKNALQTRLTGVAVLAVCAVASTAILLHSDQSWLRLFAGFLIFLAVVNLFSGLKFKDRIEFAGEVVKARRLWLRTWDTYPLKDIQRMDLRLAKNPGARAVLEPHAANLYFKNRLFLFMGLDFLPEAAPVLQAATRTGQDGILFPLSVGPAVLGEYIFFADDPRLGYSAGYFVDRTPALVTITLYLYDNGQREIGNGAGDRVVSDEFNRVCDEILQVRPAQLGELRTEAKSMLEVSGRAFHIGNFEFQKGATKFVTRVYLTGWLGKFFKIRVTTQSEPQELDAVMKECLTDLVAKWPNR